MKAKLSNYRQSPRKARLLADLLRKKNVVEAESSLRHTPKKSSEIFKKLLKSAVSNAELAGHDKRDLYIKEIRVDEGPTLKRIRPVSRGSAHPIRKRTSHIRLSLDSKK